MRVLDTLLTNHHAGREPKNFLPVLFFKKPARFRCSTADCFVVGLVRIKVGYYKEGLEICGKKFAPMVRLI